jgi:dTDP-4-dehydrorhamnose reductase
MRVLVLGAAGMLGHKLIQLWLQKYDVIGTVRQSAAAYKRYGILDQDRLIDHLDVNDFTAIDQAVSRVQPDFLVNCVGVIKQLDAANDPVTAISINSLLPHRLANICRAHGARLIHVSTDCVFSGKKGMYQESDFADAADLYGRTKLLGEVGGPGCLTLRTSIIGPELDSRNGLIEWFLQTEQDEVSGFRRAIYTGLTTIEFARVIERVMESDKELTGIYQVSSHPINKYDLLVLVREAFGISRKIVPVDMPAIDRSLDSTRFRKEMDYQPPSWPDMIGEMAKDRTPYSTWHGSRGAKA